MKRIASGERLWLAALLAASVAYLVGSFVSPWAGGELLSSGSSLFPRVIGLVLVITITAALVGTWRPTRSAASHGVDPDGADLEAVEAHPRAAIAAMIGVAGFIACFLVLGAIVGIAAFMSIAFTVLGRLRWWAAAVAGVCTAALVYLVFVLWLGVRLPSGLLI